MVWGSVGLMWLYGWCSGVSAKMNVIQRWNLSRLDKTHNGDVIMSTMASQITGVSIGCSGVDQRKHKNSASLVFARGIHQSTLDSHHKGPVTRNMFPFDDIIMQVPRTDGSIIVYDIFVFREGYDEMETHFDSASLAEWSNYPDFLWETVLPLIVVIWH